MKLKSPLRVLGRLSHVIGRVTMPRHERVLRGQVDELHRRVRVLENQHDVLQKHLESASALRATAIDYDPPA